MSPTEFSSTDVAALLEKMQAELSQRFQGKPEPVMLGIHTGGVLVAERLHAALGLSTPLGTLDISFHRDDFGQRTGNPVVHPSSIPMEVMDREVVLVDDVLHTGRTIRAALNELFDTSRIKAVTLAVLVSRDGRELPIQADVLGAHLDIPKDRRIKLRASAVDQGPGDQPNVAPAELYFEEIATVGATDTQTDQEPGQ